MGIFDTKIFNSEVFGKYMETVPRVKQNALLKAGVIRERRDLAAMLPDQSGGNFITVPMTGRVSGDPQNYDGNTDIVPTSLDTYSQSMIVVGREKGFEEKDFSADITGHNFMEDVAAQIGEYWDDVDQSIMLAELDGIFGVTTNSFSTKHTLDISGETLNTVDATTLNTAIQKAAGDNKNIFRAAIMHSAVSTNLENLQVLTYWKETDANGIQRDTALATWNGRTVLIDDSVPVTVTASAAGVYKVTVGGTVASGDKITVAGVATTLDSTSGASAEAAATAVKAALDEATDVTSVYTLSRSGANITFTEKSGHYGDGAPEASIVSTAGTVTVTTTTEPANASTKYTTYILGAGAFDYCNCGVKKPYEPHRDPLKYGGIEMLLTRQRKLWAPYGFSFIQPSVPIVSPTNVQLATAERWNLVASAGGYYINDKAIPIARILSNG